MPVHSKITINLFSYMQQLLSWRLMPSYLCWILG